MKAHQTNKLTIILFVIYLVALFWILLFKLGVQFSYMGDRSLNLIPFREAYLYGNLDKGEIISNILIFIPLGIYAGTLFKRWAFGAKLFFFFLMSLMFETLQYMLRIGTFDITDIITNTVGGIIGWIIYKVIESAFNNTSRSHKFINIIAAIATLLMITLLVLLKMNMLPVRYQ